MDYKQKEQYEKRYQIELYQTQSGKRATQMAHRIAKTKTNYRKFGKSIIDHYYNLVPVSSLEENARYNIGNNPRKCKLLSQLIQNFDGIRYTVEQIDEYLKVDNEV